MITLNFDVPTTGSATLALEVNADKMLKKPPLGVGAMLLQEFFDDAIASTDESGTGVRACLLSNHILASVDALGVPALALA